MTAKACNYPAIYLLTVIFCASSPAEMSTGWLIREHLLLSLHISYTHSLPIQTITECTYNPGWLLFFLISASFPAHPQSHLTMANITDTSCALSQGIVMIICSGASGPVQLEVAHFLRNSCLSSMGEELPSAKLRGDLLSEVGLPKETSTFITQPSCTP